MAAPQDRNGGDIIAVFISFDENREFSPSFHELILAREIGIGGVVVLSNTR
jgi:hypothetical protein